MAEKLGTGEVFPNMALDLADGGKLELSDGPMPRTW